VAKSFTRALFLPHRDTTARLPPSAPDAQPADLGVVDLLRERSWFKIPAWLRGGRKFQAIEETGARGIFQKKTDTF